MLATLRAPDGSLSDATRSVEWVVRDPRIASVSTKGRVTAIRDGATTIVARLGGGEVEASITVEGMDRPSPVSFRRDVMPAFSQAGCNMGAMPRHTDRQGRVPAQPPGLPARSGLSASSPARRAGRRINTLNADASLLLRKPLGEVAHEGGLRLGRQSKTYEFLRDWIAEGSAKDDPGRRGGRGQARAAAREPRC